MLDPLTGPAWAALALLAVAGAPKVLDPRDTAVAVSALLPRLPRPRLLVRGLGLVETVLAAAALLTGHPVLLALAAASYLGFTWFVLTARRASTPLASCGCFGGVDTPPTLLHAVVTALLAALLGAAAVAGALGAPALSADGLLALTADLGAWTVVGQAALATYLLYLVLAVLPTLGVAPRTSAPVLPEVS